MSSFSSLERTTSIDSRRYDSRLKFRRSHRSMSAAPSRSLLRGWSKYIHPEGLPYYHHAEKHLLTEANIEVPDIAHSIEMWYDHFNTMTKHGPFESSEIVLDYDEASGSCRYYLINHDERREFWLGESNTDDLGLDMSYDSGHLGLQLTEHYWAHFEYFPMHRKLPKSAEAELVAMLNHAIADQLTSEESTAPYTAAECERFVKVINGFKGDCGEKRCVIARLLRVFVHSQFINYHGQHGARLARTQSILDEEKGYPSVLLNLLSFWLFFYIPQRYVNVLNTLWVDRVVYIEHWQRFVQSLQREWTQSIIFSGLFLVLDVILIAADALVDNLTHFTIVMSSVFSLTAIVLGILQMQRLQIETTGNAALAGAYLERACHASLGLQPLSISYALPLAATFWSIATFSFGFLVHAITIRTGTYANITVWLNHLGSAILACGFWRLWSDGSGIRRSLLRFLFAFDPPSSTAVHGVGRRE